MIIIINDHYYYCCGQQSTELITQLTNSLGTSKYTLTMGKTYSAPQITSTQKAHYQHISQFPYCARRGRTEFCTDQRNRKDYRISTSSSRPDFHQGSRQNYFRADIVESTTARQEKSTPDFSQHRPPTSLFGSTAARYLF